MPRALLLHNPAAGRRDARCALPALARALNAAGYDVLPVSIAGRRARERFHAALGKTDVVVAAGGDGTINAAVNALALTDTPLLVVPCGTANDFAASLGIPGDAAAAVRLLVEGAPRPVDLGSVNGRYFVNVASLGLSARVAAAVAPARKRRWGRWAYAAEALRQARGRRREPLRICVGDRCEFVEAYQVSVANGGRFGGGWRVTGGSRPDDGKLDVAVVESVRPATLRPLGRSLELIADRTYRAEHLAIDAARRLTANLDGDPVTLTPPLEFSVFAKALRVYAPRAAAP